jgi:hypothetical protein
MRLLLLFSIALLLAPQDNAPSQQKTQKQVSTKQVKPPEIAQQPPDSGVSSIVKLYTNNAQQENNTETAKIVFDGLLVLLTGGLVWVGIRQANILNRQADILVQHEEWMQKHDEKLGQLASHTLANAKATADNAVAALKNADAIRNIIDAYVSKERARLRVSLQQFELPLDRAMHAVGYRVHYYGLTEAIVIDSGIAAVVSESNEPPKEPLLIQMHNLPQVITSSTNLSAQSTPLFLNPALILPKLTPQQIDEVEKKRLFVHCVGFIFYKDAFDRERRTNFCYLWVPCDPVGGIRMPLLDKWERRGPPEANQET